jgi:hypothetical protein
MLGFSQSHYAKLFEDDSKLDKNKILIIAINVALHGHKATIPCVLNRAMI